ncbi:hypothetical protein OG985_46230 [Streptomyces sp. NBC_00289]|uniref:hypothetical protein n=1 Tax=Streptomyces sp. NBC_00289 TaxID=2975703 RepID=UPI003246473D
MFLTRSLAGLALGATAVAGAVLVPAVSAQAVVLVPRHQTVTPTFNMFVHAESENAAPDGITNPVLKFEAPTKIVAFQKTTTWTMQACQEDFTGEAVRVVAELRATLEQDGMHTTTKMSLFDGAGCGNTDFDGLSSFSHLVKGRGKSDVIGGMRVNNTAEYSSTAGDSRDYASMAISLKH